MSCVLDIRRLAASCYHDAAAQLHCPRLRVPLLREHAVRKVRYRKLVLFAAVFDDAACHTFIIHFIHLL